MALETGNYVGDLNSANPGSADPKSQGDDHLRLIKLALRQSFAGFTGAVLVTGANGGAANAYTLTPTTPLLAYVSPMIAVFSPLATNTAACTMNISGLGAVDLRAIGGAALTSGELVVGRFYLATYDGVEFQVDTVTKQYVDQLAMQAALPLQTGNAGKFITTDGVNASWHTLVATDLSDYATKILGVQVALAVAL